MSTSAALQCYKLQVEKVTRIANNLKSFTSIVKADQNSLLKVCFNTKLQIHSYDGDLTGSTPYCICCQTSAKKVIKSITCSTQPPFFHTLDSNILDLPSHSD